MWQSIKLIDCLFGHFHELLYITLLDVISKLALGSPLFLKDGVGPSFF